MFAHAGATDDEQMAIGPDYNWIASCRRRQFHFFPSLRLDVELDADVIGEDENASLDADHLD